MGNVGTIGFPLLRYLQNCIYECRIPNTRSHSPHRCPPYTSHIYPNVCSPIMGAVPSTPPPEDTPEATTEGRSAATMALILQHRIQLHQRWSRSLEQLGASKQLLQKFEVPPGLRVV